MSMADQILNVDSLIPRWFAVYTRSRHESTCVNQMRQRSIEHFFPTYRALRRWKDRQKRFRCRSSPATSSCEFPLISGEASC